MHTLLHGTLRTCLLLTLGLSPISAAWARTTLTEAEALTRALELPGFQQQQQARQQAAQADLDASSRWPNPSLTWSHESSGDERERSWQLAQALDFSGRRTLHQQAAQAQLSAALAHNLQTRQARLSEVRLAFYQLLQQQQVHAALQNHMHAFGQLEATVQALNQAGEIAGFDRRRIAIEQRNLKTRLALQDGQQLQAHNELARLIGLDDIHSLDAAGPLLPPEPQALTLLEPRLALHPERLMLQQQLIAAQHEQAAAARVWPELSVGLEHKEVGDGLSRQRGQTISLNLSLPLFDQRQAEQQKSAASVLSLSAQLSQQQRQAALELGRRHTQTSRLHAAALEYRHHALQPARELLHISLVAYRAGESSVLELIDSQRAALEAELTAIDLDAQARSAAIHLDQLTAQDTP